MCKRKATRRPLCLRDRQELLLALSRSLLCRLRRSFFLLLLGNVELGGDHDDVVVFHAFVIGPFIMVPEIRTGRKCENKDVLLPKEKFQNEQIKVQQQV